jgi:proline dehydrogenase
MASRFISGEKLEDAIEVIKDLNKKNINATLDHLGEHTESREKAIQATQDIITTLDEIDRANVRSNVSIKLTQIGLAIDPQLCLENLEKIIAHAKGKSNYIRVDMEDSPVTQQTLDIVCQMHHRGYENVGVVIQSYMYRSETDVRRMVEVGISVRLCKGAYKEPPDIAIPEKKDVDRNYDKLTAILIDEAIQNGAREISEDGRIPPITVASLIMAVGFAIYARERD